MRCVWAAAFLVASAALAQAQVPQDLEKRGQELVEKNCGMCHATGRTGGSPNAEAPAFRTLGQRYPVESLEEALGEGLMAGHPDMPEFKFDADDVGAIIAHLNAIQQR